MSIDYISGNCCSYYWNMLHTFHIPSPLQFLLHRCGIALDTWMVPIHRDVYGTGIQQPLLFINSHDFQWVENVQQMMKLAKPLDDNGISSCQVLTLRWVGLINDHVGVGGVDQ